jgi:hypothetical protein
LKKSFIKIYGPPIVKALKALQNLAIDNPQVCIMAIDLESIFPLEGVPTGGVPIEKCNALISESKEALGEYDFFYEWFRDPTQAEMEKLISEIDEALSPLGCKYTITTK